jgi:hypothetical protein
MKEIGKTIINLGEDMNFFPLGISMRAALSMASRKAWERIFG